jgi:hypothetical protein
MKSPMAIVKQLTARPLSLKMFHLLNPRARSTSVLTSSL